ncbi:MAG: M48 family metalloprotease, partial [Gemmataceae bacterium]|nr:M48 family metalloprotease [Gemmataceae bacterium]
RPARDRSGLWLVVGGLASGLLCLFLVKGLFKRSRAGGGARVEVTEADQPALFAFLRRLCKDTNAPFPHRVYLVPDVNAAVAFDESFLNLVFPSRKNLIVGLGLVNRLDLAEFKAVLAHEFGHFSQNSMRLGSYVYSANRIVGDVVYGRDWLDDFVGVLRRTDIRIAVFAWGFSGGLWVLRKGLERLFKLTNFANSSLSRQMEYNADLVAVSVTGSDPLVTALARLDFAGETLGQAWGDLRAAADHKRYSRDLYYHQTKAAGYLRARRNDPALGEVPPLPDDPGETIKVFKPEDTGVPAMWATHPANHLREENAKSRYVRGPADPRPAWVLFADPDRVREAVTRKVYETAELHPPAGLEDPAEVQAFIDAEHAGTTYDAKYHGLYENRYVRPGEPAELFAADDPEFADPGRLAEVHARLYDPDELKERMDGHRARQEEAGKLAGIAGGGAVPTGGGFDHRGSRYKPADAPRLLGRVREEIDKDFEWMHHHDRRAVRAHRAMAGQLGEADRRELDDRYRFHLAAQDVHGKLAGWRNHANEVLGAIAGQRQVESNQFQEALGALRGAREALREQLEAADGLALPELTNMPAGSRLGDYLLPGELVRNLPASATSLDGKWIGELFNQYGEVLDRLARVLFKSLGAILALQERVAARWTAARDPAVATTPAADAGGPESPPT